MSCDAALTVAEVASRLRVRKQFVYGLFGAGTLRGFRAGRAVRIWEVSLQEYLEARSNVKPETVSSVRRVSGGPVKIYLSY